MLFALLQLKNSYLLQYNCLLVLFSVKIMLFLRVRINNSMSIFSFFQGVPHLMMLSSYSKIHFSNSAYVSPYLHKSKRLIMDHRESRERDFSAFVLPIAFSRTRAGPML